MPKAPVLGGRLPVSSAVQLGFGLKRDSGSAHRQEAKNGHTQEGSTGLPLRNHAREAPLPSVMQEAEHGCEVHRVTINGNGRTEGGFPVSAGILFGLGLGGFFDGIVLHQLLQWHHLVTSAGYPPDSVENLKVNTFWDGVFHAGTYVFTMLGLYILWRYSRKNHVRWSGKLLPGTFLMGFGIFNLVEGLINHNLLGLHHVNETVPREQWIYWDIGFLVWGAAMLIGGWLLLRAGRRDTAARR
jgi:uncharacterized membrane protein